MTSGSVGLPEVVCPIDGAPLSAQSDGLRCPVGHFYEERLGIPRLLGTAASYTDAFGDQWNRYRVTQLDSYTGSSITRDRLRRCLGDGLWHRLSGSSPVQVLETGCGAGRFTEILLDLPGSVVTSTDLSSAVEANQLNFPQSSRHRVLQCDIFSLPFPARRFDVVLCLGVIQHTPDPEAAMAALFEQVSPGGWLVIDHYRKSLAQYTKLGGLVLRPFLKRMPPEAGTAVTEWLTRLFFPVHRALRRHRRLQMAFSRVSPLLTYYHTYPELDDRLQFEWAVLDTHDSLTDYYKHLRSEHAIAQALQAIGGIDIWVARGGNGIEGRCRRPGGER